MKSITQYAKTVNNEEELRELEHFIAKQGGKINAKLRVGNGGVTVTYTITTKE